MKNRALANKSNSVKPLLDLIEQRFDLQLTGSIDHLRLVREHYKKKREFLLYEHGEAGALRHEDYAKSVLLSEAAGLMILREIDPRPRKHKKIRK